MVAWIATRRRDPVQATLNEFEQISIGVPKPPSGSYPRRKR